MEHTSLTWKAFEFEYHPPSSERVWLTVGIFLTGTIVSALALNLLLMLIFIIGGVLITFFLYNIPEYYTFSISESGIHINEETLSLNSIDAFNIFEEKTGSLVLALDTHDISRHTYIPIRHNDADAIYSYMHNNNIQLNESLTYDGIHFIRVLLGC